MNAITSIIPEVHRPVAGFVSAADALISALRSPVHASPKLRPIADELEASRDRS
jgi:hypothetical protein